MVVQCQSTPRSSGLVQSTGELMVNPQQQLHWCMWRVQRPRRATVAQISREASEHTVQLQAGQSAHANPPLNVSTVDTWAAQDHWEMEEVLVWLIISLLFMRLKFNKWSFSNIILLFFIKLNSTDWQTDSIGCQQGKDKGKNSSECPNLSPFYSACI